MSDFVAIFSLVQLRVMPVRSRLQELMACSVRTTKSFGVRRYGIENKPGVESVRVAEENSLWREQLRAEESSHTLLLR